MSSAIKIGRRFVSEWLMVVLVALISLTGLLVTVGLTEEVPSASSQSVGPKPLYVAPHGSNSNRGFSMDAPLKRVASALSKATPGTTIYVAPGVYHESVNVTNKKGTASRPITIEGYYRTPGDNPSLCGFNARTRLDSSRMPLFKGGTKCFYLYGSEYVTIKNLQITEYIMGIQAAKSSHNTFENVFVRKIGFGGGDVGHGIDIRDNSEYNLVKNVGVVNATADLLYIKYADNNTILDSKFFGIYDTSLHGSGFNAPDYYFVLEYAHNNLAQGNLIEIEGNLAADVPGQHSGHGYTIKSEGTGNRFISNTAINIGGGFVVRHHLVRENEFTDNVALRCQIGINVRDGAQANQFAKMTIKDSTRCGILFQDTVEDEDTSEGRQLISGKNNEFTDIGILDSAQAAIVYYHHAYHEAQSINNTFRRITIDGTPDLFHASSIVAGDKFYDSVFRNIGGKFLVRSVGVDLEIHDSAFRLRPGQGASSDFRQLQLFHSTVVEN